MRTLSNIGTSHERAHLGRIDGYLHTIAMAAKFETEQVKADYRKRKWIAEPPISWIKSVLGFRQFSMRGGKANVEFKLVCMALNLRRMGAMQMD